MQLSANERYPGFARKVYLKPYRYSLHMLPKTLLVEVGAQNNTKQEALNAMEPLAEILAKVVLN
jgi:stage II sporulation protein P